jgi:Mrp family chromosome partitioning ATPase
MDDNPTGERAARPARSGSLLPATRRDQPAQVVSTSRSGKLSDERIKVSTETLDRRAVVAALPSALADLPASVVDAVRFLVASLQHQEKETELPTRLGFTSALAGEGVTFIARTVAAVIAHDLRERVCVIDLNWGGEVVADEGRSRRRRRRRHSETSTTPSVAPVGLADALRRNASLREIMLQSDDPRLTTVSAGSATAAEGQVFAQSNELAHIINVLERHNDRLIFDFPPVLASSAAVPLTRQADAIGLVVRQGVTSDAQVRQALERLASVPSLGVVLNRASTRIPRALERRLASW